ncbi:C4-dicarboxylate ABC transporter permease [Rhodovibrio sodomensis]|uniref:TRAP transporter small permease protein n=1 Tax=Rhodovibrio sodomensis TaxID=1088 RepID=A0ABS1DGL1_9PROT|nr:TRAP transporter small permease subunit [Rhodovibrio sodomensis]MBK1669418.1 C4-dicarboxylate ABC transporter permease [Rhodovibrio sodomensis]
MADPNASPQPHSVVESDFVHHTELPTTRPSLAIDRALRWIGFAFSFLWLGVLGVILVAVIGRYAFGAGSVMAEEIEWHLCGAAWLVGLSYTLVSDDHVRVDVIHERLSVRKQAWIELFGLLVLLLPFVLIGVYQSWPYFWSSYLKGEVSQAPAGLPYRWAIKFFLPLSFGLLAVAVVSRLMKCTAMLFGWPKPTGPDPIVRATNVSALGSDDRDNG